MVGHTEGWRITRLPGAVAVGNPKLAHEIDARLTPASRVTMGGGQGAAHIKQAVLAPGLIDDSCP